jgi:hypothetical protein
VREARVAEIDAIWASNARSFSFADVILEWISVFEKLAMLFSRTSDKHEGKMDRSRAIMAGMNEQLPC